MTDMQEALEWALDELKGYAVLKEAPGNPFWNDFNRADAIMKGKDPDGDIEPDIRDILYHAKAR